jgi:hypothetical protein
LNVCQSFFVAFFDYNKNRAAAGGGSQRKKGPGGPEDIRVAGCFFQKSPTPPMARVRGSGKKPLPGPDRRLSQSSMREDAENDGTPLVDRLNPEPRHL